MTRNKDKANFNDSEGVTYSCQRGYSFTASRAEDKSRTLRCLQSGFLEELNAQCTGVVAHLFVIYFSL